MTMLELVAYNIFRRVVKTKKPLGHQMKMLHFVLEQRINRQLADLGLTSAQGHIIGYLIHSNEPPCARDLEEFFHLTHPTVSGLLSRMETKGFIEFRTDPLDRRIKRIYLLEKGRASHRQILRCLDENEQRLTAGFSPEERELFSSFLERAAQNLCQCAEENNEEQEETI